MTPSARSSQPATDEQNDDASVAQSPTVAQPASRRRFFAAGVSLAAAIVAAPARAAAQQAPKKESATRTMVRKLLHDSPGPAFDPFKPVQLATQKGWDSLLTRLVRRVTNGVTQDEMTLARKLGFNGYLNYHLAPNKIDDSAVNTFVGENYPWLSYDGEQLYSQDQNQVRQQLVEMTLYRAAFSKRQLYERMVEFWSDHFNIVFDKVDYLKLVDDREVIRKNALGSFPTLLKASAHSPAMLEYLDNTRNRQRTLNENYAREIMELHTVGVNGGYTQVDVRELARVLTGWTLAGRGTFFFDPSGHDFGEKTVMGQKLPAMPVSVGAAAKSEGEQMLDFLVKHPNTARFISKKMLRWLLQYDPSEAQITAVASTYTRTNGDIPSMIRAILTPANLTAATPKYKRPFTYMVSVLRATKPTVTKVTTLHDRWMVNLGQPLFEWSPPDGYPDRADYWAGNVLQRWNFAVNLTNQTSGEYFIDPARFAVGGTADAVADAINRELFGGEIPDKLKTQLLAYMNAQTTLSAARVRETVALALSSSSFQWL